MRARDKKCLCLFVRNLRGSHNFSQKVRRDNDLSPAGGRQCGFRRHEQNVVYAPLLRNRRCTVPKLKVHRVPKYRRHPRDNQGLSVFVGAIIISVASELPKARSDTPPSRGQTSRAGMWLPKHRPHGQGRHANTGGETRVSASSPGDRARSGDALRPSEGGGPNGTLVVTSDDPQTGFDTPVIKIPIGFPAWKNGRVDFASRRGRMSRVDDRMTR